MLKASASASVVSSCQILAWRASSIACAYLVVVGLIVSWLDVIGLEDGLFDAMHSRMEGLFDTMHSLSQAPLYLLCTTSSQHCYFLMVPIGVVSMFRPIFAQCSTSFGLHMLK